MKNITFNRLIIASLLTAFAGAASAQSSVCSSALSSVDSGSITLEYAQANHPECFGNSGATSNSQITATAFTQATSISRSIASRLSPFSTRPAPTASLSTGLAAGANAQKWNVWANVDQNDTEFSYNNGALRQGENNILTTVVGTDYALASNMVVGLSLAFDDGDGWGSANAGAKNKNSTDGYMIAPYFGYQLSKELSVDLSAGMGTGDFSATGGITADADRWFAAANVNYSRWMGDWQITGKASYLHGEEDYGKTKLNGVAQANTGSTNKLDQIRLGAQAGLWMNGFMPYAGLGYTSNVHRTGRDPLGRDSFVATLGVNFFSLSSKVTGGLFYEQELNRKHSDNQVISANVNFRF